MLEKPCGVLSQGSKDFLVLNSTLHVTPFNKAENTRSSQKDPFKSGKEVPVLF